MADVILTDGTEITIDLSHITWREHKALFNRNAEEKSDETMAKACGLSLEQFESLSVLDAKRITQKYFIKAAEPLADPLPKTDPNSPSASISP